MALTIKGNNMRLILFFVILSFFSLPALAQDLQSQDLQSRARLVGTTQAADHGESVHTVVIDIELNDGWKTYWRTPGDAGLPPALDWTGSKNLKTTTLLYPAPHRFTIFDIDNFGYKERVLFPVDIIPQNPDQPVIAKLKLDLLVCSDICVPETHHLTWDSSQPSPEAENIYAQALTQIPVTARDDIDFRSAHIETGQDNRHFLVVKADIKTGLSKDADLFVESAALSAGFSKPDISMQDNRALFTMEIRATDPISVISEQMSAAPLVLTLVDDKAPLEVKLPLTTGTIMPEQPLEKPHLGFSILLAALLGGLVLNLMPCVLPVLSLKILSVVKHSGSSSKGRIFTSFMASAAGIIASFWILAASLVALKSAGSTIGWGIQFQHSGFLIFMIAVVLIFALNMWGFFEIPMPRFISAYAGKRQEGTPSVGGHFLSGMFATLLATPCTAPFLGTAVGFALAGRVSDIFIVFTFLGIGLALPYIVLALSPGLFKYMPKPGRWMEKLKKILALALLATALWLGSVLYRATTEPTLDIGWQKFDAALIAPAVEEGKVVIVDVTADWCLTCKANKKLVLDQKDIAELLAQENILKLQADWTQRDEDIAAYLRSFGKYGIPFNVVYGPGAPEGIVLPELLTKRAVTDALTNAFGE